jgi:hypothetical protein
MLLGPSSLDAVLSNWCQQLSIWAQSGAITRAAIDALQLIEAPDLLQLLVERWGRNDFQDLPPVELLPASSMPGAAGAYAISTGTIYLNQGWLQSARPGEVVAVLTEELGHHLDALLHEADTLGDEGALFAALLLREGVIDEGERLALRVADDRGSVLVGGRELEVEQAAVVTSTPIRVASPGRTGGEWRNRGAFAALKSDGSVVTWGDSDIGGDSRGVASQLRSGVQQIFSSGHGFAALKSDGSVVTWGMSRWRIGDDSSDFVSQLRSGVQQIFSASDAFAALKSDGSVVTWGESFRGGDSSGVASQLRSGVVQIFSSWAAFAALKSDGSVVTWGWSGHGGYCSG